MIKVVLDSNVIISAIFFGGNPKEIIENIIEGKISLYLSYPIIDEIKKNTHFSKL